MALRLAGAAEVALNARLTEAERRHCLTLSQARLAITSTDQADAFRALGCDTIAIEDVEPESHDPRAFPPVPADAWGRIGFTSGTTGKPKAVVTTHGARWIGNILQRAHFDSMPGPGSRVLLMTPFVHGAGLLAHAFHDLGAGIVLLDGVDLPVATTFIIDGTVDFVFAPPTVLAKLLTGLEGRRIETGAHRCSAAPRRCRGRSMNARRRCSDLWCGSPTARRRSSIQLPSCSRRKWIAYFSERAAGWRLRRLARRRSWRSSCAVRSARCSCVAGTCRAAISTQTGFIHCRRTAFTIPAISAASTIRAGCT